MAARTRRERPAAGGGLRAARDASNGERRKAALDLERASASTVMRLSGYYRALGECEAEHVETIASDELAARGGATSAQVRKDLSLFGNFGRRGLGYNVEQLRQRIGGILGLGRRWSVALVGAGNLGHALFSYKEFQKQGFFIEHVLDADPRKIGAVWDGVAIVHIGELPRLTRSKRIDIAIIAVPTAAAQTVIDVVVTSGIHAVLNFAPGKFAVPDGVALRNVDLSIAMESLSYALVQ